jgi:hypothetical protein
MTPMTVIDLEQERKKRLAQQMEKTRTELETIGLASSPARTKLLVQYLKLSAELRGYGS